MQEDDKDLAEETDPGIHAASTAGNPDLHHGQEG